MKGAGSPASRHNDLLSRYRSDIEQRLFQRVEGKKPYTVYDPIRYVLKSGGKRFRAVLLLLSCEAVGGQAKKALDAAAAIEILHNFTLVHDDVMDHAGLRRGLPSVPKKWDENVAILAGDEMIAQAYRTLLKTDSPNLRQILAVYTRALVEVCEGQGFDKEFEKEEKISLSRYFNMIKKKTASVIAASAEIGGLIGRGRGRQIRALREYGEQLGRAFQVRDDLLDVIGNEKEFGKKIGGDIQEGKKTFLLVKAVQKADGADLRLLRMIKPSCRMNRRQISRIRRIYQSTGAIDSARREIGSSTRRAQRALQVLPESGPKSLLLRLSEQLLERTK